MSKFGGILVRSDNSYALVVGISRYKDERIRELPYTDADAGACSELLTDPRGAGFQKENVRLLLNAEATRNQIIKAVNHWLFNSVAPDSTVLIFFAGHRQTEENNRDPETGGKAHYLLP